MLHCPLSSPLSQFFSPGVSFRSCWRPPVFYSSPWGALSSCYGQRGTFVAPRRRWGSDAGRSQRKGPRCARHPHREPETQIADFSWMAVGFCHGHMTCSSSLTGRLMSELLISDWVVELLDDWDAELPFGRDLGRAVAMLESVTVMFMDGGSAAGSSTVGDGVGGSLLAAGASA